MLEVSILKHLLRRENYDKYYPYIKRITVEPEQAKLFALLPLFFKSSDKDVCSIDELKALFSIEYPQVKEPENYVSLFRQLEQVSIDDSIVARLIKKLVYKDTNNRIIQTCMPVLSGVEKSDNFEDVLNLVNGYDQLILPDEQNDSELFVSDDIGKLVEKQITGEGLSWPLASLQGDIGDLHGGTTGHVFAEVEMGKTTFVIGILNHWRKCLKEGEVGLYICNEESGERLKLRYMAAVLQWPIHAVLQQLERAQKGYVLRGGDKVKFLHKPEITLAEVHAIIKRVRPRFVVIDQGDNIITPHLKETNETARLGKLYKSLRSGADTDGYDLLTVGQASDAAAGKNILTKSMMNNSKVEKPAAQDYIIGIGSKSDNPNVDMRRWLTLCKSKVGPCGHGRHMAMMEPDKGRYIDV